MYSVYIVDDESLIIEDIAETIDFKDNGFFLIGSNTDSVKAYHEICKTNPDVVFCDLRMPAMVGTELLRKCREKGIESEFVMLSAFAEFEASREFFVLGGFDYLLKPVEKETVQLTLEKILEKLLIKSPRIKGEISPEQTSAFDDLVAYVNENYTAKHSLKSLSQRFFISETYICDLFAKKLSTTFTMYKINIRMKKAGELVTSTNLSMKEIAGRCGYGDYFYFCRVFKNFYGITPSEFRKRGQMNG